MATSRRENILTNIAYDLGRITVANGYKTTIATVERVIRTWSEVEEAGKPWVCVQHRGETYEHQPFGAMRVAMTVSIVAHMAEDSQTNMRLAMDKLLDDLIVMFMRNDHLLKGAGSTPNASSMRLQSSDTDEETDRGGFTLRTDWEVIYFRDTEAS